MLASQGMYAVAAGITWSSDSIGFARWGAELTARGFDYFAYFGNRGDAIRLLPYTAWLTVVALYQSFFGEAWAGAIVATNVLVSAGAAALISNSAYRLTRAPWVSLVAGALFVISFDAMQWSPYVMSDSTFSFLVVLWFWAWLVGVSGESKRTVTLVTTTTLTLIILLYRPTGVAFLPVALLGAVSIAGRKEILQRLAKTPAILSKAAVMVPLILLIVMGAHAWLMESPSRWPIETGSSIIRLPADHYGMGEVVWKRYETFHPPPTAYTDYLAIALDRFVHFFFFVSSAFSRPHNAASALFFVPVYGLGLYAALSHLRPASAHPPLRRLAVACALLVIASFAVCHALFVIDFNWRYRLPVLPFLILVAALGAQDALRGYRRNADHH